MMDLDGVYWSSYRGVVSGTEERDLHINISMLRVYLMV